MSATGLTVPKVQVERWKEALLVLDGKGVAAPGLKHLPGGLSRCHSEPGVIAPKHSGLHYLRKQHAQKCSREGDRRRKSIRRNPSQACPFERSPTPAGSPCTVPVRPSSQSGDGPPNTPSIAEPNQTVERRLEFPLGAGGYSQGAKIFELDRVGYDPTKHGWYHPKGRSAQALMQATGPHEHASWEWDIRKAKDHIGYPPRDVRRGHVIRTSISNAGPNWFLGVGMDNAPKGGHRLPYCEIFATDPSDPSAEDSMLHTKQRIFDKGPMLSVKERHDLPKRPGTAASVAGSVQSIRVPKQCERPSSAPIGGSLNTAPGQTSVTFDDWRGAYQDHADKNRRCQHSNLYCDFHPCHSHQGWRVKSDLVGGSAMAKQKKAPASEYVGIDGRFPGGRSYGDTYPRPDTR